MKLAAGVFRMALFPRRLVDDEDWVRVQLVASTFGLSADFEAWLQLENLRVFEHEVEAMYATLGGEARLSSAEPDICLTLTMTVGGQIQGLYRFQSAWQDGRPSVLSGAFECDQSYLPALASSVRELISELSN